MDLKELEKLSKLCRKHGIKKLKSSEVEIEFDHLSYPIRLSKRVKAEEAKTVDEYSEEDVLNWSSTTI